jgi:hypothetical protein
LPGFAAFSRRKSRKLARTIFWLPFVAGPAAKGLTPLRNVD